MRKHKRSRGLGKAVGSVSELKSEVKQCGSHWFDADTMRFFKSKVERVVYPNVSEDATYFVSSEQGPNGVRAWSVRKFHKCSVRTVGEFQGYRNAAAAKAAARKAAGKK
jgi:hypothetical protein